MVLFGGMHGFIWGMRGFIWGGMCGFIRGHAWFYSGGMRGFIQGACMVLFGGVWFYLGGMRGFIWGGHAWFFQFFWIQWDTVNERAVHILLECILVSVIFFSWIILIIDTRLWGVHTDKDRYRIRYKMACIWFYWVLYPFISLGFCQVNAPFQWLVFQNKYLHIMKPEENRCCENYYKQNIPSFATLYTRTCLQQFQVLVVTKLFQHCGPWEGVDRGVHVA